jgi:uncharacterized repeat protein (TIGR03803 family)
LYRHPNEQIDIIMRFTPLPLILNIVLLIFIFKNTFSQKYLYGVTSVGGINGAGVIFSYNPTLNIYSKKYDFGSEGSFPAGSLTLHSNGKLYGVTTFSGLNSAGVIFEYDLYTNVYTKKIDLGSINISNSFGSLIEFDNGKLYGMSRLGGINGGGAIYEYSPQTNTLIKKIDLSSTNGINPYNIMMRAANGKLYGTTNRGGNINAGVIFEYDPINNNYTKKIDLSPGIGYSPIGVLTLGTNGKFYSTASGGAFFAGVIFEYDYTTNTYTKKIDLNLSTGASPRDLVEFESGIFYGMTNSGGIDNTKGVLFEYILSSNTYTVKKYFTVEDGYNPEGSLLKAFNGKLYGMTYRGGINEDGVIFEYDPANNTYTKKIDLIASTGKGTTYGHLIEVCLKPIISIISNSPICENNTLALSATGGVSYSWTGPNAFTSSLSNSTILNTTSANSGIYSVQVQNECGTSTATVNISITSIPNIPILSSLTNGNTANLSASGCNGVVKWYDSPTGTSVIGTGNNFSTTSLTNIYYADCTQNNCTSAGRNSIIPCPNDHNLSIIENTSVYKKYEAVNRIFSNSKILQGNIRYDSGTAIELNNGFEVKSNAVFFAEIDGCGNR